MYPSTWENGIAEEQLPQESAVPSESRRANERRDRFSNGQKPMNIGSVTIEFNMFPGNVLPRSDFSGNQISSNGDGNSSSIGKATTGVMNVSPSISGVGHEIRTPDSIARSRGHEQFSTINIGDTILDRNGRGSINTSRGLEKRMSDLQNAVLINNWIKILESTKNGNRNDSFGIDGRALGVHTHEHADSSTNKLAQSNAAYHKFAPAANYGQRQATMASVNLTKFFNVPSSVLRDFDRLKQLNSNNSSEMSPRSHVDEGLVYTGGVHLRPEGKPHVAGAGVPTIGDPRRQHHGAVSYRRWLPRMNAVDEGLMDLLAIQRIDTGVPMDGHDMGFVSHDNKSHATQSRKAVQGSHPMVHLHNLHHEDMEPKKQEFRSKLKIRVNIPRDIGDSVSTKPLLKLSPRVQNTTSESGHSKMGSIPYDASADQQVDNLLLNMPPIPRQKYRGNQRVIKRDKAHSMRQNPFLTYGDRKEMPINMYPELSVVGSSMLDTSEAAWREEAKALIIQMLESKGRQH